MIQRFLSWTLPTNHVEPYSKNLYWQGSDGDKQALVDAAPWCRPKMFPQSLSSCDSCRRGEPVELVLFTAGSQYMRPDLSPAVCDKSVQMRRAQPFNFPKCVLKNTKDTTLQQFREIL